MVRSSSIARSYPNHTRIVWSAERSEAESRFVSLHHPCRRYSPLRFPTQVSTIIFGTTPKRFVTPSLVTVSSIVKKNLPFCVTGNKRPDPLPLKRRPSWAGAPSGFHASQFLPEWITMFPPPSPWVPEASMSSLPGMLSYTMASVSLSQILIRNLSTPSPPCT